MSLCILYLQKRGLRRGVGVFLNECYVICGSIDYDLFVSYPCSLVTIKSPCCFTTIYSEKCLTSSIKAMWLGDFNFEKLNLLKDQLFYFSNVVYPYVFLFFFFRKIIFCLALEKR